LGTVIFLCSFVVCSFVGIRSYSYFDGGVGGDDDFYLGFLNQKQI